MIQPSGHTVNSLPLLIACWKIVTHWVSIGHDKRTVDDCIEILIQAYDVYILSQCINRFWIRCLDNIEKKYWCGNVFSIWAEVVSQMIPTPKDPRFESSHQQIV